MVFTTRFVVPTLNVTSDILLETLYEVWAAVATGEADDSVVLVVVLAENTNQFTPEDEQPSIPYFLMFVILASLASSAANSHPTSGEVSCRSYTQFYLK